MSRAFKPEVSDPTPLIPRFVRALALLALLVAAPTLLAAQEDSTFTQWLRFRGSPLTLQEPATLRNTWDGATRRSPAQVGAAWDSSVTARRDSLTSRRVAAELLRRVYGRRAAAATDSTPGGGRSLLGLSRNTADLRIDGTSRVEIRTERLKNLRCTPSDLLDPNAGCSGGFRAPRLDNYLSVRAGGLIGRRVHVNIDYDSERDFNARNNLQVYYEGLDDEVVRRVEVGTVTFTPPPSKFLTAAIPANNFGVNATFEVGALQLQGIAATQKGSVVAERTYQIGSTTVEPQDREVRDLDFESRRFYWVVDPTILAGYPTIDILQIDRSTLPPAAQVDQGDVRVYRYRPSTTGGINPNLGGINAVAIGSDPTELVTGLWTQLQRDIDYYVDGSGLWFALGARLDQNDYLAVSYQTPTGRVGTFPATDHGIDSVTKIPRDTLRLIVQPKVDATRETFRHEMRQIYRVAGSDLDPGSLKVQLSLNRSERPLRPGAQPTYLSEFGLATLSDANTFNLQDRLFPRNRDASATGAIRESFIIFPELQPFANPAHLLATERNDSIYGTPGYLLLTEGPSAKFAFRLRYNASSSGDRSTLDLGALQIREKSEVLYLNGRRLDRGIDYNVDYGLGQVTFLSPQSLFGEGGATIQARFEERGIFVVAPTQIYGLATRYSLGDVGGVNLMGIYQVEQSAFNRPALGFEASAHMVGGISTDLKFRPQAVTRFLNGLTSSPAVAPSQLTVNAEVALTRPDPNRSGQAYLEEFEGDPGLPLSMRESSWSLSSRPQYTDGIDSVVGAVFDTADAVQLTWQNLILDPSQTTQVELKARDIDDKIQIAGEADQLETVLYTSLHRDTDGGQPRPDGRLRWTLPSRPGAPRWRSMVTPLSATGADLSRNEFLEFWVFDKGKSSDSAGVKLVLDIGTVSEDAVAVAPDSFTVTQGDTLFFARQFVGGGRLDSEREPSGIFNAAQDDIGILGDRPDAITSGGATFTNLALCTQLRSGGVNVYPWGDFAPGCSNGNGFLDGEDLDGDLQLDAAGPAENSFRWVVDLRNSAYFVRDGVQSGNGSGWKLYRIPLRQPGWTLGSPDIRLAKHLRFTVVASPDPNATDREADFAFARMRFLGSPWVRRSGAPITGLAGATAAPVGDIVASTVSTENSELGYTSPPGVVSALGQKGGGRSEFGLQINERSLRLIGKDIAVGQRAEAYFRFPSGPQNLLRYRELRLWARGHGPGWNNRDFQAYFRVGSDSRNFYQYATPSDTTTWDPEIRVDLERWRALRAQIELRRLQGLVADSAARVACGGDTVSTAYVVCDGPYLAYIQDPAVNPPNLASVQELSGGILRVGNSDPTPDGELWLDDIRLVEPISKVGSAVSVSTRLVASDVGDLSLSYTRQDGYFQQIGGEPSYRTTNIFQASTGFRADRFLPTSLGILLPVSLSYARTNVSPQLLTGTDILAGDLGNLRKPESWTWNANVSLRRSQRGKSWVMRGFVDPLSFNGSFAGSRSVNELSQATAGSHSLLFNYLLQSTRHGVVLGLGGVVDKLPGFLRNTDGGEGLRKPFLNLVPSAVRLSTGLVRSESDLLAFDVPILRAADSTLRPVTSLSHTWRNSAGLSWQPLGMLSLSTDLASTRDLRHYADSTSLGRLAGQSRKGLLGLDVGVERDRQLTSSIVLTPRLVSWLRPRYTTGSSFVLSRSLTSRDPVQVDGDTLGRFILPQTLNNTRSKEVGLGLDLNRLLAGALGDSAALVRGTRRLRPVDLSDRLTRGSTFDLAGFNPSLGYQYALGGLRDFLLQDGDSAIAASESRQTTLGTGADLPLGLSLNLAYSRTRTTRYQRALDGFLSSQTQQREWPRGNVRLTRTLRGTPLAGFAVGTSFRSARGSTVQPTATGQPLVSATRSSNWVPDAQLTLRNGMVFTASYSLLTQDNAFNGNRTLSDQKDLTTGFNHAFQLPASISATRRTVRSQLSAVFSRGTTCLEQPGLEGCQTVADTRRTEYRAGLDTDIAAILTGGLQFSYSINEARHLDRKFSQMIVSLNFQLSLYTGDYR